MKADSLAIQDSLVFFSLCLTIRLFSQHNLAF
ncbi:hypothetical protein KPSA3_01950 [Pseudomonas syringae pv. actinidiae]|uniref:Uncharacterized protein n=1 Tax=Pseudomonas syringae pv. actinidiae TaxID=103796 RepID=A0AAN4Q2N3_PSESF|nr:hypothetical protein KPSA3_01950 [Pseudomonas syringae pv. actinidiae]